MPSGIYKRINKYQTTHYQRHKNERKLYYLKNKESITKKKKEYAIKHPEKRKDYWLKRRYNITPKDYNILLQKQYGVCAICMCSTVKALYVDHDHITGKIRGLLCSSCNAGLGHFRDNAEYMLLAIKYLNEHL